MEPDQNKSDKPPVNSIYPEPTRGVGNGEVPYYAKPKKWSGPKDRSMTRYYVAFLIILGLLFIWAVKSLSSAPGF